MPWRVAYRVGGRIAAPLAARQPRALLAVVVLTAFIIAISQAIQHGEWSSAAVLSTLALCPVISPIADAAISRASERGADLCAAQIGYNKALTLALRTTQVAEASQPTHPLLRDHPDIDRRLRRLEAPRTGPLGQRNCVPFEDPLSGDLSRWVRSETIVPRGAANLPLLGRCACAPAVIV